MESKVKLLGHPVHPMLIVFPLGLLVMALIFDILYMITQNTAFATASYYDIPAGVLLGLLAAVFGFTDWLAIPSDTRAKKIGLLHGIGNVIVVVLFAVSWLMRTGDPLHVPTTGAVILAILGGLLGAVTGWLGGELVDRLGVGVDRNANLNAPSSISNKPVDITNTRA